MIPVVVALKSEMERIECVRKTVEESDEFCLTFAGMGKRKIEEKLLELENGCRVDGLISAGFAGSLDPELESGRLVLVNEVTSTEVGRKLSSDREWLQLAREKLNPSPADGLVVTALQKAGTTEKKKLLQEEYDADLVDMESYWIASHAAEEGVPFLGLRVVFDEYDQSVPPFESEGIETEVNWVKLFKWIAGGPERVLDLPGLFLARKKCASVLRDSVTGFVDRVGVNGAR